MEALFYRYLKKAREELRKNNLEAALDAVQCASFIHLDHVDVICCRVEILQALSRFEDAAECLQDALKLHPYHPLWVLELADMLLNRLQSPGVALDWLVRLMRCCQLSYLEQLRAYRLQVEALIDEGRLYEASLTLHTALTYYPRDTELLFWRGWVYLHRSLFQEAMFAFHRVLRCDPEHADAHYYLGLAFAALGEVRLMQCHLSQAFELDQQFPPPLRYHHQEFEQIARYALSTEPFVQFPHFHIKVLPYPSTELLDDLGHDPRRPGVLLPAVVSLSSVSSHVGFTLLLFQHNIERFCCSEMEIIQEIQQIALREWDLQGIELASIDQAMNASGS